MSVQILIRKAGKADIPLLTSSWLRAYRYAPAVETVPDTLYYKYQHKILEELLPRSTVLVACDEEDPNHIMGWICGEFVDKALIIHFIYVKALFRQVGVARKLFTTLREIQETTYGEEPAPFFFFTHRVGVNRKGMDAIGGIYNPYLLGLKLGDLNDPERNRFASDNP